MGGRIDFLSGETAHQGLQQRRTTLVSIGAFFSARVEIQGNSGGELNSPVAKGPIKGLMSAWSPNFFICGRLETSGKGCTMGNWSLYYNSLLYNPRLPSRSASCRATVSFM
eukprot:5060001-Pyramimonas_sp.AAC.1